MDRDASNGGNLFLAAVPDAVTADRIVRLARVLKRAHGFSGKLTARERLHMSLLFLGGLPDDVISEASAALARVRLPSFEAVFDRSVSFRGGPRGRPFVLIGDEGPTGLKTLRQMLGAAVAPIGLRRRASMPFTPHVTLLYDARMADEYPVFDPVCWRVKEFVLVASRNGHTHLHRWPLRAE